MNSVWCSGGFVEWVKGMSCRKKVRKNGLGEWRGWFGQKVEKITQYAGGHLPSFEPGTYWYCDSNLWALSAHGQLQFHIAPTEPPLLLAPPPHPIQFYTTTPSNHPHSIPRLTSPPFLIYYYPHYSLSPIHPPLLSPILSSLLSFYYSHLSSQLFIHLHLFSHLSNNLSCHHSTNSRYHLWSVICYM